MSNQCDVKKLYDTEFEATIAAAKTGHYLGVDMHHYRCGSHWHIANDDPLKTSRNRTDNRMYCDLCNVYFKKGRWERHSNTRGHIRREKRKED